MDVQVTEGVLSTIKNLSSGRYNFQIGLLLAFQESERNILLQLIPTPLDATELFESPLQINKSTIGEHAFQVTRSVVGGVRVAGIYLYSKENIATDQLLPFLTTVQNALRQSIPSLPIQHPLYILQIGEHIKYSYSIFTTKQKQVVPVRTQSLDSRLPFQSFETFLSFQFTAFTSKYKTDEKINAASVEFLTNLQHDSFSYSIDGTFFSNPEKMKVQELREAKSGKYQIKVFSHDPNFLFQVSTGDPQWFHLACKIFGSFNLVCVALPSSTIEDVFQFLWEDYHRSLLQRMEVMGLFNQSQHQWAIPTRVFVTPKKMEGVALCDYQLPNEAIEDCIGRLQELFSSFQFSGQNAYCNELPCLMEEVKREAKTEFKKDITDKGSLNELAPIFPEDDSYSLGMSPTLLIALILLIIALLGASFSLLFVR